MSDMAAPMGGRDPQVENHCRRQSRLLRVTEGTTCAEPGGQHPTPECALDFTGFRLPNAEIMHKPTCQVLCGAGYQRGFMSSTCHPSERHHQTSRDKASVGM